MKIVIKIGFVVGFLCFFFACQKDDLSNLPLSKENWEKAAPVPNINGQYDFFKIVTNINKELIAETPSPNSSTNEHYYYKEDTGSWFLINNFRSSTGAGSSNYTFLYTPKGNLMAIERYNSSGSMNSNVAIWNLDNASSPVKLVDQSITMIGNYYQVTTNGDIFVFGPEGLTSQGYVGTLYNNNTKSIQTIDCSLLGIFSRPFFNNISFFALGDDIMIRYDDQYYVVNRTTQKLDLSNNQLTGFAVGDLDIGTGFEGQQTYLEDGTLIASTKSAKILEWIPGAAQPTIYTFNNPEFNINRSWKFIPTEDNQIVIETKQKSTICPEDILYLMEKNGREYGYRKIVSDYSDCSTLGGCVTVNNKIYGVVGGVGSINFMAKIDFN